MKKINDTNETCRQCGKPTVALCGTGRSRWCPDCEGHTKKKKDKVIHGNGFDLLPDLTPFEEDDSDEKTVPIDLSDIFLDDSGTSSGGSTSDPQDI